MSDCRYAILALAPQVWHAQWVNRQQLLSRIGRHHTVLYSTGGWFMWDRSSDEWRRARFSGRMSASDNVWLDESPRYLMRWPRIGVLDRAVMRAQARRWSGWLRRHADGAFVAHVCHPSYFPYVELLEPDRLVYHVYDLYDHQPGWQPEWGPYERELLQRSDLTFCPSEMLAQALRDKVPRKVEVLPNAADVDAFFDAAARGAQDPPDLAAIPHPRIGWVGSIHPQIDYGLIAALAKRRSGWHFVFVGNKVPYTEERAEQEYLECERLPNVHFLGYKHRSEVPFYVINMDVNIMPYRVSEERWVKVAYPLKLHEYLASGRPVVSVDLEMVRVHKDVIRFATGVGDWERAIDEALEEGGVGTPEERIAVASEHSWDARARVLRQWLAGLHAPGATRTGSSSREHDTTSAQLS
jgi:glycosyltransferase involved in cell wall biosynthesis